MTDVELLREYAERRSEEAFASLVSRYSGLVFSVAARRVQNTQIAEEVTQGVFLLLARKARKISRQAVVSGWLFQAARFVSADITKAEARRKIREHEVAQMDLNQDLGEGVDWEALTPLVDDSIGKLKPTERNAILLRFFERKNYPEMGQILGISEEAARKRVDRAVEKMRGFFAARDVAISGVALASALEIHLAQSAPQALAATVTKAVVAIPAVTITQAVLNMITCIQLKTAIAGGAFLAIAATALVESRTLSQLRNANGELQQSQQQLLAENQHQFQELQAARDEIVGVQAAIRELSRLRGEVGQLRREKQELAAKDPLPMVMNRSETGPSAFEIRVVSAEPSADSEPVSMLQRTREGELIKVSYNLQKKASLDQSVIESAEVSADPISGSPEVLVHFNESGRQQFAQLTKENLDKQLAILVDGQLRFAPVIRTQIADGQAVVPASTEAEAKQIVESINQAARQRQP
jgi:RNA polymerase sigma factor (sigma-70 family)